MTNAITTPTPRTDAACKWTSLGADAQAFQELARTLERESAERGAAVATLGDALVMARDEAATLRAALEKVVESIHINGGIEASNVGLGVYLDARAALAKGVQS